MDNSKARTNVIFGLILALVSLVVAIESLRMPTYSHLDGIWAAPGLLPFFLSVSLLLMGIAVMVSGLKAGNQKFWEYFKRKEKLTQSEREGWLRLGLAVILTVFYIFVLLGRTHYVFSTAVYLFSFICCFTKGGVKQKVIKPLVIAILTSVVINYVFSKIFLIPLP